MRLTLTVCMAITMGVLSGCAAERGSTGTRTSDSGRPIGAHAPVERLQDPRIRPPGSTDPMDYDARERYYEAQ